MSPLRLSIFLFVVSFTSGCFVRDRIVSSVVRPGEVSKYQGDWYLSNMSVSPKWDHLLIINMSDEGRARTGKVKLGLSLNTWSKPLDCEAGVKFVSAKHSAASSDGSWDTGRRVRDPERQFFTGKFSPQELNQVFQEPAFTMQWCDMPVRFTEAQFASLRDFISKVQN